VNKNMRTPSCIHPGEILKEEFLVPLKLTQYRLAKEIKVPARRINEIIHGNRSVTIDTALRLARFFGTTPQLWLNLQSAYEMDVAKEGLEKRINQEVNVFELA